MATINPYLNFNGNCEEAFRFYRSVFGGEFDNFQRFKDMPDTGNIPVDESDYVLHVSLPIGKDSFLMGSDTPSSMGEVTHGSSYHISIQSESDEETNRLYKGLSAGGEVTMPLQDTFWGARYAMFVDKFGVQWMINQDIDR